MGVETALRLFHARGYDGVGTAELCEAIGVRPPSLYAAYGSKLGLFDAALDRYAATPSATFVAEAGDRAETPSQLARNILAAAAHRYGEDPERLGCLALEGSIAPTDQDVRERTGQLVAATRDYLVRRLDELGSDRPQADAVAILTAMRGLSAAARAGEPPAILEKVAADLAAVVRGPA